jgi:hypothetical protein
MPARALVLVTLSVGGLALAEPSGVLAQAARSSPQPGRPVPSAPQPKPPAAATAPVLAVDGVQLGMRLDDLLATTRLKAGDWLSCYYTERDPVPQCDLRGAWLPWRLFPLDTLTVSVDRLTRRIVWARAVSAPAMARTGRATSDPTRGTEADSAETSELRVRLAAAWGPPRPDETDRRCAAWGASWDRITGRRAMACTDTLGRSSVILQDGHLWGTADSLARVHLPWVEVPSWVPLGHGPGALRRWWPVWRPLGLPDPTRPSGDALPATLPVGADARLWLAVLRLDRSEGRCARDGLAQTAPLDTVSFTCRWLSPAPRPYILAGQAVTRADVSIGEPTGAARSLTLHFGPYPEGPALQAAVDSIAQTLTRLWGPPAAGPSDRRLAWGSAPFRAELGRYCARTGCPVPDKSMMVTVHLFTLATDQDQRDEIERIGGASR